MAKPWRLLDKLQSVYTLVTEFHPLTTCGREYPNPHSMDEEGKAEKMNQFIQADKVNDAWQSWNSGLASCIFPKAHHFPSSPPTAQFSTTPSLTQPTSYPLFLVSASNLVPVHLSIHHKSDLTTLCSKPSGASHYQWVQSKLCAICSPYMSLPLFSVLPALHVLIPVTQCDCRPLQMLHMAPPLVHSCSLFSSL